MTSPLLEPVRNYLVPNVIETTSRGERHSDLYSRMLRENIIFVSTPIDDTVANHLTVKGDDLLIKYGDDTLLIKNMDKGDLDAADFLMGF